MLIWWRIPFSSLYIGDIKSDLAPELSSLLILIQEIGFSVAKCRAAKKVLSFDPCSNLTTGLI